MFYLYLQDPLNIIKHGIVSENNKEFIKDEEVLQETHDYKIFLDDSLKEEQLSNYSDEGPPSDNSESDNEVSAGSLE